MASGQGQHAHYGSVFIRCNEKLKISITDELAQPLKVRSHGSWTKFMEEISDLFNYLIISLIQNSYIHTMVGLKRFRMQI